MGNISTLLLILVFLVIGATLAILLLAVLREALFWYWRSKGVMQEPEDILNRPHETALIIRKSIAGMKIGLAPGANSRSASAKSGVGDKSLPHPGFSDPV
jgi:hypothetical protein